jgi:UDP-N-acetylglucosamine 4-epimerase
MVNFSNKVVLITGGAGFIGRHLVNEFLNRGAQVRVLDNLATGFRKNVTPFLDHPNYEFIEGDIRNQETCLEATKDCDWVCHQAALGSVPRSLKDPVTTNEVNISGFINMLDAARRNGVSRFVYAASSSTYGDSKSLPKVEDVIGNPLSPYAITKYVNELYAKIFSNVYGIKTIGLRYFNVFGPHQDPNGAYAAVIPLFIKAAKEKTPPTINGDGLQTRDFTYVDNAVEANMRAFEAPDEAYNTVYNVAYGDRTTLIDVWRLICNEMDISIDPNFGPPRAGDIRDSLADISKARQNLSYDPKYDLQAGLKKTIAAYLLND